MRTQSRIIRHSLLATLYSLFAILPTAHALTDAWSVDVRQNAAVQRTYKQGESWDMAVTLRDGLKPLDLTGATASFFWHTNASSEVWWTAPASVEGASVRASWTPAMDVGATVYPWWIGVWAAGSSAPLWRVTGTIRLLPTPGYQPGGIPPSPGPGQVWDFATITYTNAPWLTLAEATALSNAFATALQGITAQSLGAITNELDPAALLALAEYAATNKVTRWQDAADPSIWWEARGGTSLVASVIAYTNHWTLVSPELFGAPGLILKDVPFPITGGVYKAGIGELAYKEHNGPNEFRLVFNDGTASANYWASNVLSEDLSPLYGPAYELYGSSAPFQIHVEWMPHVVATNTAVYDLTKIGQGGGGVPVESDPVAVPLIDAHTERRDNPHRVTAAQTGATTPAQVGTIIEGFFLTKDSWLVVDNDVLSVWQKSYTDEELPDPEGGEGDTHTVTHVSTNRLWQSGDAFPPAATGLLWQVVQQLQLALDGKADRAWGKWLPDGSVNPDPAFQTVVNSPVFTMMGGFQWATYGGHSFIVTSGATAFESGGSGSARFGPDVVGQDWFGYETGGSVVVGAVATAISVTDSGTPAGLAHVTYEYFGGDFPTVFFTPDLVAFPFTEVSGVWVDNGNGTATVTLPATTSRGFWRGMTEATYRVNFVSTMPAMFRGGVYGNTAAPPVVYDSTVTISVGGVSYRIPAQALGTGDEP